MSINIKNQLIMDEEFVLTEEELEIQRDFEEYCREIEQLNPGCTGGM